MHFAKTSNTTRTLLLAALVFATASDPHSAEKTKQDTARANEPVLDLSSGKSQFIRVDPKTGKQVLTEIHQRLLVLADCISRDKRGMWLLDSLGDTLEHVSSAPGSASWAPDEIRFVCVDPRSNLKILALDRPQGGIVVKLPPGIVPELPVWSPDGGWIAFIARDSSRIRQIWKVRPDSLGSQLQQLTKSKQSSLYPCWSPDGTRILFSLVQEPPGLYSIPSDGGMLQSVFRRDSVNLIEAVYTPDANYILAANTLDGNIYRLKSDGTEFTNLTKVGNRQAPYGHPRVMESGKWIVFAGVKPPAGAPELFRMPINGGVIIPFTKPGDGMSFISAAANR